MKDFLSTVVGAGKLWYHKDAGAKAAVVSYYMLFAVTPILLLTVSVTGFLYGKELVVKMFNSWGTVLGEDMLILLHEAVLNLEVVTQSQLPLFAVIFFSVMIVLMCNAFSSGLQQLWGTQKKGLIILVLKSARSLLFIVIFELYLVVLIGFALLLDGMHPGLLRMFLDAFLFTIASAILFSLMYSVLVTKSPPLRCRLVGGFIASILFLLARWFVAWYVLTTPVPGLFGTAGLILVLLIWVYVSVSVIYYGAAFAHVNYTKRLCAE